MTAIASRAALLHAAVQDMHAGKVDAAARPPAIAAVAGDPRLATILLAEATRGQTGAAQSAEAGGDMAGPRCLWTAGMLTMPSATPARRNRGPLLDIALIGTLRKVKAAEIAAADAAVALARGIGEARLVEQCEADRAGTVAADRALAGVSI